MDKDIKVRVSLCILPKLDFDLDPDLKSAPNIETFTFRMGGHEPEIFLDYRFLF